MDFPNGVNLDNCKLMGRYTRYFFILISFLTSAFTQAQQLWPKLIRSNGTTIKIYQPQVESFNGDVVKARGAFAILEKGSDDPVFGALWADARLQTDRTKRTAVLKQIKVNDIRFSGDTNTARVANLKALLEREVPKWDMVISLDQLEAAIEGSDSNPMTSADGLSTIPPKIIYVNKPSTLVLIDGEPKVKENGEMGVDMVMNTAFTIAKIKELYYLYGSGKWYTSNDIRGPWKYEKSIPGQLEKLDKAIKDNEMKELDKTALDSAAKMIPEIIVSTEPAELIQSNGEADFAPIQGTTLLYMTNTNNDLFMNITDQRYYVLLSGRWYQSASLQGPWTYTASDKLPDGFAKIPVNSAKDAVLSSVAGTDQAQDAVMDAQIPQTAKVDRLTATAHVRYDGEPKFASIEGTGLQYAVNTGSTVLLSDNTYYCVENGIWFEAFSPEGPWRVAVTRPSEVDKIPATVPVYNAKYVYIYDVTPQFVYVGYTPGYFGCYVYGGTVIYGTGYYYYPWYGPYYYPRPVTYGFGMQYNPWYGWSIGYYYSAGWFNYSYYGGWYHGGYWGPPIYRPPYYHRPGYPPYYRPPYYPRPGYKSPVPMPYYRGGNEKMAINNNIYRNNNAVSTTDRIRAMPAVVPSVRPAARIPANGAPATQPATRLPSAPDNHVTTDRQGNVYRKDGNNWQEKTGDGWQNLNQTRQAEINRLNQQQALRDRGNMRTNNFNQSRPPAPSPRPSMPRPSMTRPAPAPGGRR